jgi:uncharacterized protein (TIGR03086 family)
MDQSTDPRTVYARARTQTAGYVAGVKADQLDDPTPCPEYTVRGLLSHLVGGLNRAAHVGEGGNALDVPARVDDVPDDGWPAAFAAASERVAAAWADDAKLDEPRQVPWGTVPGRGVVAGYVQEVLTHGWDLAKATGQPTEGDPELAEYALASALRFVPAEGRDRMPFDAPVPVPDTAGPYTRLAAWLGRQV